MNILSDVSWLYRADIIMVAAALLLLAFAHHFERSKTAVSAVVGLAAVAVFVCGQLPGGKDINHAHFALVVVPVVLLVAALLLGTAELFDDAQVPEVGALLIVGALGAVVLGTGKSLLELALGVEMLSLSAAALVGLGRGARPLEGAFKYFILTALTFATLLFGMALMFLGTGSMELQNASAVAVGARPFVIAGAALMSVGLMFKIATVPVHFGALDAYTTGPSAFVGFIMVASKVGAAAALVRIAHAAGPTLGLAVSIVGIVTIGVSVVASFAQIDLRRLLAYSAVAHAGFLAVAAGSDAAHEARYYVVGYGASALLAFAALAGTGTAPFALRALARGGAQPLGKLRAGALLLALASMAGVPPLPGFWAKLAVLQASFGAWGLLPTALAALGGVLGIIYYLRPIPDLLAQARAPAPARPLVQDAVVVALIGVVLTLSAWPAAAWSLSQ